MEDGYLGHKWIMIGQRTQGMRKRHVRERAKLRIFVTENTLNYESCMGAAYVYRIKLRTKKKKNE